MSVANNYFFFAVNLLYMLVDKKATTLRTYLFVLE